MKEASDTSARLQEETKNGRNGKLQEIRYLVQHKKCEDNKSSNEKEQLLQTWNSGMHVERARCFGLRV
eukprot:3631374-Pleurochrysis_carterae.AAC.1